MWVETQEAIRSVHQLEVDIFSRARELVFVSGMVASFDDWKWKYNGMDAPIRRKLSSGGNGWTADVIVSTPEHYVLDVRKRGIVGVGARDTLEDVAAGPNALLSRLSIECKRLLLVMDRGYMTLERALDCALCPALPCRLTRPSTAAVLPLAAVLPRCLPQLPPVASRSSASWTTLVSTPSCRTPSTACGTRMGCKQASMRANGPCT